MWCEWQAVVGAEPAALGVLWSDERAGGEQQQAAAGGAPEEVAGGQLQAERVSAGGVLSFRGGTVPNTGILFSYLVST